MKRPTEKGAAMHRRHSRRRFLSALSGASAVALAGCSEVARSIRGSSPTPAPPTSTPGYEERHWHGRLFFEIDGNLVDFSQPKYYLENVDDEDAIYFHFHETAHGPNEWSNELEVVTFDRALNLLPGIAYERGPHGGNVVTFEGTTYRQRDRGTEISISEGTAEIDPRRHYVRHGDVYWVRIDTGVTDVAPPADHRSPRVGTLLFDVNNRRLDFSRPEYLPPSAGTETLHFHDDGHPYRWYAEGDGATFQNLLDVVPDVTYRREGGDPVVTIGGSDRYAGTYRSSDDGTTITTRQRTTDVRPANHELATGDILWVYVHTDQAPENEH